MRLKNGQVIQKGSQIWLVRIAELTSWVMVLLSAGLTLATLDQADDRFAGWVVTASLAMWVLIFFRALLPTTARKRWIGWVCVVVALAFGGAEVWVFRDAVATSELLLVAPVLVTGLVGSFLQTAVISLAAVGVHAAVRELSDAPSGWPVIALHAISSVSIGGIAALLAREVRSHFHAERREHRLATAVRHRLLAVLDAVDEAIVFSDTQGNARVVNRRAGELFELDPNEYLGLPLVHLMRRVALEMDDPDDFMERFQPVQLEPVTETRIQMEQIIPERRQLRVYSGPATDETGAIVGRIDVFTDISEAVQRSAEIERLYEAARSTAESYQRSLLPTSVPKLPRVSMVAHYVAAAGRRAVCGDFYDFVPSPDGKVGVVLGDVCGVGPRAANDAALTRYTLRSFVGSFPNPDALLQRMNTHVNAHLSNDRFVRLLYGLLDPERAVFEYANAGHVPPLVYHAKTGEVEWLGEGGIALAVEDEVDYKIGRVEFEPGDMLVMYTDGVTEAPRAGRPLGQGKLKDIVAEYGVGTPGELVQAIRRAVEAWVEGGELRDDIALLVCQVVPDAVLGQPTRELVLPNEPARIAEVRRFVAAYLADVRAPVDMSSEILLAVGEAAGNACRHGQRQGGISEIRIRCTTDRHSVSITVADDGVGFDLREVNARKLPDRFASGGRGLFLMRELMDEIEIDTSPTGTIVKLTRAAPSLPQPG